MKSLSGNLIVIATATIILLCGFNSMFTLVETTNASTAFDTEISHVYATTGERILSNYFYSGQDCATPMEGDLGGLYAMDGSNQGYIFIDSNYNQMYDSGENVISYDPDNDGIDANPQNEDEGGLCAIPPYNDEFSRRYKYFLPYIFVDENRDWMFNPGENVLTIDPNNDGNHVTYHNEGDLGGLIAFDIDSLPYVYKDENGDNQFSGEAVKIDVSIHNPDWIDSPFIRWWWTDGKNNGGANTWDECTYAPFNHANAHAYSEPGTYDIKLTVADNTGCNYNSEYYVITITDIGELSPSDISISPTNPTIGDQVNFNVDTSNFEDWRWLFDENDPYVSLTGYDEFEGNDAYYSYTTTGPHKARFIYIENDIEKSVVFDSVTVTESRYNLLTQDFEASFNQLYQCIDIDNNFGFTGDSIFELADELMKMTTLYTDEDPIDFLIDESNIANPLKTLYDDESALNSKQEAITTLLNSLEGHSKSDTCDSLFQQIKENKIIDTSSLNVLTPPTWAENYDKDEIQWTDENGKSASELMKDGVNFLVNGWEDFLDNLGTTIKDKIIELLDFISQRLGIVFGFSVGLLEVIIILAVVFLFGIYVVDATPVLHNFIGLVVGMAIAGALVILLDTVGFFDGINKFTASIPLPYPFSRLEWDVIAGVLTFAAITLAFWWIYQNIPGFSQLLNAGICTGLLILGYIMIRNSKLKIANDDFFEMKSDVEEKSFDVLANDIKPDDANEENPADLYICDFTEPAFGSVEKVIDDDGNEELLYTPDDSIEEDCIEHFAYTIANGTKDDTGELNTWTAWVHVKIEAVDEGSRLFPNIKNPFLNELANWLFDKLLSKFPIFNSIFG